MVLNIVPVLVSDVVMWWTGAYEFDILGGCVCLRIDNLVINSADAVITGDVGRDQC